MNPVIIGSASTNFGEHPDSSSRQLFRNAAEAAVEAPSISASDIDALYVGNFMGALTDDQGHMGALMADYLGIPSAPALTIESACASSGVAIREATQAITAGQIDVALVGGVEMMLATGIEKVTDALANAADHEYENQVGLTFPGIYGLMAREYMHRYGVTKEDLAAVAVKNRKHGVNNPIAQYQRELTIDEILDARPIAPPLGLLDCCPITDGASAVVIASSSVAQEVKDPPHVQISGSGQAGDTLALQDRDELCWTTAAELAGERAYTSAGIEPADVDVCEVHDCFTIAELFALESLGFVEPGRSPHITNKGETEVEGRIPVNTSGGLLAKGHPVGATGVAQLVEITKQLEDRHPNQVDDATIGLTHNVGGSGASAVVHVMEVAG